MPPIASDALVLRTYKLGETSKIVVLLTRERGKLRAVAKGARGARSRYQSALEPLSEVRVGLHGRQGAELFRLGECELLRSAFRAGARGPGRGAGALVLRRAARRVRAGGRGRGRRLPAGRWPCCAAAEEGRQVAVLARYLEAWLLRLHGHLPAARPLRGLRRRAAARASSRYHAPAHGFVCAACGPASGPVLPRAARARSCATSSSGRPADVARPCPPSRGRSSRSTAT